MIESIEDSSTNAHLSVGGFAIVAERDPDTGWCSLVVRIGAPNGEFYDVSAADAREIAKALMFASRELS